MSCPVLASVCGAENTVVLFVPPAGGMFERSPS